MKSNQEIITRLKLSAQRALLGMIYPELRSVAVGILAVDNLEILKIIYYLNRIPNDGDYENISAVSGEILGDFEHISNVEEICEFTSAPIQDLNMLDVCVYARSES